MTICFFGTYNRNDPRNRVLLTALKESGVNILECNSVEKGLKKYLDLYKKFKDIKGKYDLIFVAFPGYATTILAKLSDFKHVIILDSYISYYDTLLDRKNYFRFHPRLLLALMLDKISTSIADEVLTINGEYKKFFVNTIKVRDSKIHVIRKGADETLFYQRNNAAKVKKENKFIIGWYGSFIPLHGIEYIIEAAKILKDDNDIEFWLIGRGQTFLKIEKLASDFNLQNVKFLGRCPYDQLPSLIDKMDIVLGIFSPNPKAMRCVTNKVYEAMAMGKAIITEDSPANREIFSHREDVYLCQAGSGKAIAKAILELKGNQDFRKKLELNSLELFKDRFSKKNIAASLLNVLKKYER